MLEIFEIASRTAKPLAVAGLIVASVFFVVREIMRRAQFAQLNQTNSFRIFKRVVDWFFMFGLTALVLGFLGYGLTLVAPYINRSSLYQVSVSVLDADKRPALDAKVISAPSGTQSKTDSGWVIQIPESALDKDKKLTVWATREDGSNGSQEMQLSDDYKPRMTIGLQRDVSARIKGRVTDEGGNPLSGAVVYIATHSQQKVTTGNNGLFDLAAHTAAGQYVHLFIEKESYQPWNDVIPAGVETLATFPLTKK